MEKSQDTIESYLEIGAKRTFAGALAWPGWCRGGRDEASALQALVDYAPRYARAIAPARIPFHPPAAAASLAVVERLKGGAGTDFGAPEAAPAWDAQPLDEAGLRRLVALLRACWQAFDTARQNAAGKELRKGPRGGGRELDAIAWHVQNAEQGYLSRIGWKVENRNETDLEAALAQARQASQDALAAIVADPGAIPSRGPRGGVRWTPRYFVRRMAWHVLDHAWEIEDRAA